MKAGVIMSGTGAILVLTACDSFEDPQLVQSFREKGITKYIALEVPVDLVKDRYGSHFQVTLADRKQSDVCRVIDVDGARIFRNFPLSAMGRPVCHEDAAAARKAA